MQGPFLRAISALYSRSTAAVKLLHAMSKRFVIRNGTRQGCPVTTSLCPWPLPYALNPDISGVAIKGKEFKITLYPYDVLLSLTSPLVFLPNLHAVLDTQSELSRYKINTTKTEAVPINCSWNLVTLLKSSLRYTWQTDCLKYLEVYLTFSYGDLFAGNYVSLYREIPALLKK